MSFVRGGNFEYELNEGSDNTLPGHTVEHMVLNTTLAAVKSGEEDSIDFEKAFASLNRKYLKSSMLTRHAGKTLAIITAPYGKAKYYAQHPGTIAKEFDV